MINSPRWRELSLPGGARLWITLASAGFLLAALVSTTTACESSGVSQRQA